MKTIVNKDVDFAINLLVQEEIIGFPTETVYGLAGSILRPSMIQKIFKTKGRPLDNPLIVHVHSKEQACSLGEEIPDFFEKLVDAFWPGPLTLILKRREAVPDVASAGLKTIALRMPKHPMALALLRGVNEPLAAPSANLSGRPSPTSAQDVLDDLEGKIPFILDGGNCSIGIESTVLSLVEPVPTLYRLGSITQEEIETVLGFSIERGQAKEKPSSPGMKYRHYAPKARVRLIFDEKEIEANYVLSRKAMEGRRVESLSQENLYRSFRKADREGISLIDVYCDERVQSDLALMDRLRRASQSGE